MNSIVWRVGIGGTFFLFAQVSAAPVGATFVSGVIGGGGYPTPSSTSPMVFTVKKVTGGGSTGGGFASAKLEITDTIDFTSIRVTGSADHRSFIGYTGAGSDGIVFGLSEAATFSITNLSTTMALWSGESVSIDAVRLFAVTGSIKSSPGASPSLAAGTYRIAFGIGAGPEYGYAQIYGCNNTTVEWNLTLKRACTGDLNADGFVDDGDFSLFVIAYNILACGQPGMPAGCPADFNNDGAVDDADFVLFLPAYNALLCP